MIKSFHDDDTRRLFERERVPRFRNIESVSAAQPKQERGRGVPQCTALKG